MLFFVDPQSGVPLFRQIIDQVKLHIASGLLKAGDELPSIRNLSIPLGVNPMTISKAYNLLVHDQVLIRRPGRPLIVAEIDGEEMIHRREDQLRSGLQPAVNLIQQLEIPADQAVRIFESMLAKTDTIDTDRED
jgi:DNA-binding transcriptional regulator YhcF (GntR family)